MIKVFLNRKLTIKEFVELYTLRKNLFKIWKNPAEEPRRILN